MQLITIAIPAFNEAENLPSLEMRLDDVLKPLEEKYQFEIILLDNASTDNTRNYARELVKRDLRWRYVRYSRNFGFEASMTAGIDRARGEAVIQLVSDLQDPPELIPELIARWEDGYQVVYGEVRERNDYNQLKTLGARIAYWLIYHLTDCKIKPNATDYRLLDRDVVEALKELREPHRYMRGMVHWLGYRSTGIPFDRAPREKGASNNDIYLCIKIALHAILCFSAKPLHLATWFGIGITVASTALGSIYVLLYFIPLKSLTPPPPGIMSLFLFMLFSIGLNSLFLGIIGEYIGRIFEQGKRRPLYYVDEDSLLEKK